jgi:hypothetical protein
MSFSTTRLGWKKRPRNSRSAENSFHEKQNRPAPKQAVERVIFAEEGNPQALKRG